MRLTHAKVSVDNTNSLETQSASIELNSTIIHVLSRDLYTKPIESMFREILVNALDSHIEAGTQLPVEIKMPGPFDESWYIRDYGTGISHEKFMGLYMSYGTSTRRDSDDYTGAFGLGCKSPLAYTSAFQVNSYLDGVDRVYLVYYNEDNIPQIDLRQQQDTDEPNGLKVSLSTISAFDYTQFRSAANNLLGRIHPGNYKILDDDLSWFSPYNHQDPFLHLEGVKLFETDGPKTITIVMGYVGYEMDVAEVKRFVLNQPTTIKISGVLAQSSSVLNSLLSKYSVEINADIGSYPIHPSREFINITPRAIKQLISSITKFLDQLFSGPSNFATDVLFVKLISTFPDEWGAQKVKARYVYSPYSYRDPYISSVMPDYATLVKTASTADKPVVLAALPDQLMVSYVGSSRNNYKYPRGKDLENKYLIFYEKDLNSWVDEQVKDFAHVDLLQEAMNYTPDVEYNSYTSSYTLVIRESNPLFKEPKHNVLLLKADDGSYKRCWESSEENVTTLKGYGVPIFYIPVKMGCVKDLKVKQLLSIYTTLKSCGIKNYPLVIGLPASKGTKTIEKAFQPLEEFEHWLACYMSTDSFRRALSHFNSKSAIITANFHRESLKKYAAYYPAFYLYRILNKYRTFNNPFVKAKVFIQCFPELADAPVFDKVPEFIEDLKIKFPLLTVGMSWRERGFYEEEESKVLDWVESVAIMLNQKSRFEQ